uniref:Uncharacterized protein n=1 Tax=Entomoneis paludosa TaxID=265537 RepID=A0A7S3DXG1_9STRA
MLHGAQQIGVLRLRLRLHTVTTPEQARAEVAPFGLTSQHHLPARLGGTALTPEAWLAQRLQLEHSRYAFLENPPTTTTLVVPPPPQENPTTPTINWQELREWSEERAEQKALQKLQQQHESLRQQEALLQAQITCANSVAQQYESDHQKIQDYLQTFLEASVVTTTDGPAALATAAQEILQHLLFFRGRNAVTGQFMFESQTAGQDEAVVQQIALLEQALPLLTCTILKQHEERSSTTTSTITRTGIIISDHEEEEEDPVDFVPADDSLDRTIQALQQQLADLQSKQDSLSKQQDFLQASQVCAQDTAQGFDTYQQETLPRLKKSIVTLLTSLSQNLAALDPTPVAQRILSKVLWFGGSEPPPVTAETLSLGLETSLAVAPETTLDQKAPSQNPKQMEANTTRTNTSKPVGEIVWRSDRCLTKECKNVKNVCIVDENRI